MTDSESSFNLACFDDDFESIENLRKIHEYYECMYFSFFVVENLLLPLKIFQTWKLRTFSNSTGSAQERKIFKSPQMICRRFKLPQKNRKNGNNF